MGGLLGFVAAVYGLYVDEDAPAGQGLVEYALLLPCVALACLVAVIYLQDQLGEVFSQVAASLGAAGAGDPVPAEGTGVAPGGAAVAGDASGPAGPAGRAGSGSGTPACPPTSRGRGCR